MSIIRRFCERICGHAPHSPDPKEILPTELRQASHAVANRAAEIDGISQRIHRDVDALARLSRMVEKNRRESGTP